MRAWETFAAMAVAFLGAPARANAPAPEGYTPAVEPGGTVEIHVMTTSGRRCPDDGLLRRNTSTGEIVQITTCSDDLTFVDQCVLAGEYQYGLATPLACQVGGTEYYETATVTDGPAEGCTRTIEAPAPATSVPWGSEKWVCRSSYRGPDNSWNFPFGCGTGGVLGTNLLVVLAGLGLWRWRPGRRRA